MNNFNKLLIIIFIYNNFVFPQENANGLKYRLDSLLTDQFFQSALPAVDIYDLTSGESLYRKNEKMLYNPASNMKILTTVSALLFLEPDYKFYTTLYYSGNILNNILYGDLYVIGRGDPIFYSSDLDSLVKEIKKKGIREINGNIYADISWKDSVYWGNGWMWNDDPSTDAPYLSALNINENSIEVFASPTSFGKKADIYLKPETGYVNVVNKTITTYSDSNDDYEVTRDWMNRKNTIIVSGLVSNNARKDSANLWQGVNILNPPMYFMTLLYENLMINKIKVDGTEGIRSVPENAVRFLNYYHTIDSVIVNTNKPSYNLGAEMLLYALAAKDSGCPAIAKNGTASLKKLISTVGLDPENYSLADGSGVSRYNLVSAELILSILKYLYMNKPDIYQKFYNSLPIAGIDGTLKRRMLNTSAQNNVHAKTGSLRGVSSLSGYVTSKNNHEIAFSILMENFVGSSSKARNIQDLICEMLAEYN
ncbi:MAG: D-alanyl-D-alanine carboxypeptidase/D-alanyl-D-alanine-endopeptidase [Ignavibacteriaceae bacterium]